MTKKELEIKILEESKDLFAGDESFSPNLSRELFGDDDDKFVIILKSETGKTKVLIDAGDQGFQMYNFKEFCNQFGH